MLEFILAIFANYRLSRLVSQDEIFKPIRAAIGKAASGKGENHPAYWLAELVYCPYCLGVWFAVILAWLTRKGKFHPSAFILRTFAIAGGQAWLQSMADMEMPG
jgi:hypothetical protein